MPDLLARHPGPLSAPEFVDEVAAGDELDLLLFKQIRGRAELTVGDLSLVNTDFAALGHVILQPVVEADKALVDDLGPRDVGG